MFPLRDIAPVRSTPVSGGAVALGRSTMQGVTEYFPAALVVYGVIVAIGHVVFRPAVADPNDRGLLDAALVEGARRARLQDRRVLDGPGALR